MFQDLCRFLFIRVLSKRLLGFALFRICCFSFACTWFVPDEWFQSVELSYWMVYGRGKITWEWFQDNALRSIAHPALYAIFFKIARIFRFDSNAFIRWSPFFFQALLFAYADSIYYRYLQGLKVVLCLYFFNWFILYCSARSLANTLETVFVIFVLEKSSSKNNQLTAMTFLTSIISFIRPTSTLITIPLLIYHLIKVVLHRPQVHANQVLRPLVASLVPVLLIFCMDSIFYGQLTFCLWNFIKFNIIFNGNVSFGTHPAWWYFVVGLPSLLTIAAPLTLFLVATMFRRIFHLNGFNVALLAIFYTVIHSFIPHKEHRFILPTLPLFFPFIASLIDVGMVSRKINAFLKLYLFVNICCAAYFGMIHQRGPYAASSLIRAEMKNHLAIQEPFLIFFLMPCYSMPMFGDFHSFGDVRLRMLECNKRLEHNWKNLSAHNEESEVFNRDPEKWISTNWRAEYGDRYHLVVLFEHAYKRTKTFWAHHNFILQHRIFHTHFLSANDQDTHILILKRI